MSILAPDLVPDRSIPVPDLLELILSPSPRCEIDDLGLAMTPTKNRMQGGAHFKSTKGIIVQCRM